MRTKRNLLTFALGGAAGFVVGRYPYETFEKVRGGAGMTVGLARDRIGVMTDTLPFGRAGDHRAATTQASAADDGAPERTSTAYVSRPRP